MWQTVFLYAFYVFRLTLFFLKYLLLFIFFSNFAMFFSQTNSIIIINY